MLKFEQYIGERSSGGINANVFINFESQIILRLHEVFRCRHLHDIVSEFLSAGDHVTEVSVDPRNV